MLRNLLVLGLVAILAGFASAEDSTRWTMLNLTPSENVADSHLLELPGDIKVLIDAGKVGDAPGIVLARLKERNVTTLDLVIISHFHVDHYGALLELIENGIKVKRIAVNVPDKAAADREKGWGCDLEDVNRTLEILTQRGISWFTPKAGDCLQETVTANGTPVCLEVLAAYDGLNTPIGPTDVNDTSIIIRLRHGSTRALFTGDLNLRLGGYLASTALDLRADLLKAPHHGTESTVPNEFFDRVGARALFVPSPKNLWESARSMRIRNYFSERKIPAYVSGINGSVTVTLTSHGYRVETER